jgi:hypothetical protein
MNRRCFEGARLQPCRKNPQNRCGFSRWGCILLLSKTVPQGLNRSRKKSEREANPAKDEPAGAKAQLILLALSARPNRLGKNSASFVVLKGHEFIRANKSNQFSVAFSH